MQYFFYVVIFFCMFAAQKKMFMGRFKLSKNNEYRVRLESGLFFSECSIRGVSTLQALQDSAYLECWRPKYRDEVFPVKMIIKDKNNRKFFYAITITGNVRTSK